VLAFLVAFAYVEILRVVVDAGQAADPLPAEPAWWPWLSIAVLPAVIEEWLCRGILWEAARRFLSSNATILLTAALFALLHGLGGGVFLELPHRFVAGLFFGFARERSGSLLPAIAGHFVLNGLAITFE